MAGYRQFHTKFWKDEWTIDLDPLERYLFIYLFTNDLSSISGLYRLPFQVIINETGLEADFVRSAMEKFERQGKIKYQNNTLWVVNMERYHSNASPKTQIKFAKDIALIPDGSVKQAYLHHQKNKTISMDTVSIEHQYSTNTDSLEAKAKEEAKEEAKAEEESNEDNLSKVAYAPLENAFIKATGLYIPTGGGTPTRRWVDSFLKMQAEGVTPADVTEACAQLVEKDYSISGPSSILNAVRIAIAKRTGKKGTAQSDEERRRGFADDLKKYGVEG